MDMLRDKDRIALESEISMKKESAKLDKIIDKSMKDYKDTIEEQKNHLKLEQTPELIKESS